MQTTTRDPVALPQLDVRALARRAAVPGAVAALAAGALMVAGGPLQAFAGALDRALAADPRWVVAAACFELLSFTGYVALLWLVAGRATRRIDARRAVEVTLAGAAATRLLPTAGAGGAALTLWAIARTGLGRRRGGHVLLTLLVLLYSLFLLAIALSGAAIAFGLGTGPGHVAVGAVAAVAATVGIVASAVLG